MSESLADLLDNEGFKGEEMWNLGKDTSEDGECHDDLQSDDQPSDQPSQALGLVFFLN